MAVLPVPFRAVITAHAKNVCVSRMHSAATPNGTPFASMNAKTIAADADLPDVVTKNAAPAKTARFALKIAESAHPTARMAFAATKNRAPRVPPTVVRVQMYAVMVSVAPVKTATRAQSIVVTAHRSVEMETAMERRTASPVPAIAASVRQATDASPATPQVAAAALAKSAYVNSIPSAVMLLGTLNVSTFARTNAGEIVPA